MGRIDKELAEREQRNQERREAEERRILREKRCVSDSGDSEERNDGTNDISPNYLTEDLVGLAFFCDDVPDERKLAMLSALQKPARKQMVKQLEAKNIVGKLGNMELDDFLRRDPENCLKSSQLIQHSWLTILHRHGLAWRSTRTLRGLLR